MTNLITEARELCEKATPGPWKVKTNRHPNLNGTPWGWIEGAQGNICWSGNQSKLDAMLMSRSRTLIPELCDALEKAQGNLDAVWGMYQSAERELKKVQEQNKKLVHELSELACESVKRDVALAKLEAEVMARLEEHHEAD